jgi:hypothetical protein
MMTAAIGILTLSAPLLVVVALLGLAGWRDRRREAVVARQIRLTDAIGAELGAVVAPVVSKGLGGPWRIDIRVPVGRPATVSRIVAIAHDTLTRTGAARYELILTPEPAPIRPIETMKHDVRRLQAA